jgi:hypothetical protein
VTVLNLEQTASGSIRYRDDIAESAAAAMTGLPQVESDDTVIVCHVGLGD